MFPWQFLSLSVKAQRLQWCLSETGFCCYVVIFILGIRSISLCMDDAFIYLFIFRCRTSTHCRCSRTTSMLPTLTLPQGVLLWSWYGSTGSTSQWRARRSLLSGIPNNCVFTTNSLSRKVTQQSTHTNDPESSRFHISQASVCFWLFYLFLPTVRDHACDTDSRGKPGGCSHICLLSGSYKSRTCRCRTGYSLGPDAQSCKSQ